VSLILSCDPGSRVTGWAFLNTAPLSYCDSGIIVLDQDNFWDKIRVLKAEIERLVTQYQPDVFVLEKAFVSLNKQTALKLAQIRGCLMGLVHHANCEYAEYSPREIKQQITGYGAATKEQVALMCQRLLPTCTRQSNHFDETDAIAIGLCHALRARSPLYHLIGQ